MTTTTCLNCGAQLTGPYCASCGQKQPHGDLTLREFLHEMTAELVHWEGKVPATLKALFVRPGLLTQEFLGGRRARWLPPLRVYLICSIAFFVSGPLIESVTHRSLRQTAKVTITGGAGATLSEEDRRAMEQGLPARIFGIERLERAAADPARLNHIIQAAFPKAMFVLVPLFALLTSVAWRGRKLRYPAHLYLALHVHAAWFGALTVLTVFTGFVPGDGPGAFAAGAALMYVAWYALMALSRVFGESWGRTLVKSLGVAVVYALCLLATSLGMLGFAISRM